MSMRDDFNAWVAGAAPQVKGMIDETATAVNNAVDAAAEKASADVDVIAQSVTTGAAADDANRVLEFLHSRISALEDFVTRVHDKLLPHDVA